MAAVRRASTPSCTPWPTSVQRSRCDREVLFSRFARCLGRRTCLPLHSSRSVWRYSLRSAGRTNERPGTCAVGLQAVICLLHSRDMQASIIAKLLQNISLERRRHLRRLSRPAWLGTLRRTTPLSDEWGFDRGTPVDRYYIECFLEEHHRDIHGRVLELRDSTYTDRYGIDVERSDVLDINPANSRATIIADLTAAHAI